MNLAISISLTLLSIDSNRKNDIAPRLKNFFDAFLVAGTLSLLQIGDNFRFIDLNLQLTKRTWNLMNGTAYLEFELRQTPNSENLLQ